MSLSDVFLNYCGKEEGMQNRTFTKVCQDAKLIDKKFVGNDCDLIFKKVVEKGKLRVNFEQFEKGLLEVANRKGMEYDAVCEAIISSGGPAFAGTQASAVRLHDDKTTYTGAHAQGGLDRVSKGAGTATQLASKGMGTGQGVAGGRMANAHDPSKSPKTDGTPANSATTPSRAAAAPKAAASETTVRSPQSAGDGTYQSVFKSFCGTNPDMDGKSFNKLCKDCGLVDKKFTSTDADLAFSKSVTKGQRRLTLAEFDKAAGHIADKKGISKDEVLAKVAAGGGPVLTGTATHDTRFHDDKSTYTGTHVYGGPEAGATGAGTSSQSAAAGMKRV